MIRDTFFAVSLLTTGALLAQTQTLRGKVEDVQGTQNRFVLACTNIPLTSSALDLNAWVGQQAILQVADVGSPGSPVLRVDSAVATVKTFDMGNLRQGQSARWQVTAPAGSAAFVFVDFTSNTRYAPFGPFGTFLLGTSPATLASGTTNAQNQFEITFGVPVLPALVGTSFSGQALIGDHGAIYFSNPDCKTFE